MLGSPDVMGLQHYIHTPASTGRLITLLGTSRISFVFALARREYPFIAFIAVLLSPSFFFPAFCYFIIFTRRQCRVEGVCNRILSFFSSLLHCIIFIRLSSLRVQQRSFIYFYRPFLVYTNLIFLFTFTVFFLWVFFARHLFVTRARFLFTQ